MGQTFNYKGSQPNFTVLLHNGEFLSLFLGRKPDILTDFSWF